MDPLSPGKNRVHGMDELRGFLIIFVVLYHLFYDLAVLFPVGVDWMFSDWMNTLRDIFTGTLIVVSGVSCLYSRSNLRRGLKTFGWALVFTLVTLVFMPSQLIIFGILHFFGVAMILYALLEKPLSRIPTWPGLVGSFLLFFFTRNLYYGVVGFGPLQWSVPSLFYNHWFLFPLGFRCYGISSADYYPILPWFFLFLAGGFLGRLVRAGRFPAWFYRSHCAFLGWIGRHTLIIYLLHQPIVYGVLSLIFMAR